VREIIVGFLKAAGWGTTALAAGAGGAALFGAGMYTGAKAQRKITRVVIGNAMGPAGNAPEEPKAEEPMKTAGLPLVLGAGALVGAGAVAGVKLHKALARGPILKGDAYKSQVRQKQLERQGTFAS